MRQAERIPGGTRRRRGGWTVAAVLAGGLALAACSSSASSSTTTTTSGSGGTTTTAASSGGGSSSGSGLSSVLGGINKSSNATFSATYTLTEASTGKTETITFAQQPPKSAIITSNGSFYVNGTTVTECQGSGSTATCTSLPSSMTSSLSALTGLFSPTSLATSLKAVQAESNAAGYSIATSTATYGGLASKCVTVKGPSVPNGAIYCGSTSSGVLTYTSAAGNTVTLQSFTSNPPASTFAPPAGATVQTLPAGV